MFSGGALPRVSGESGSNRRRGAMKTLDRSPRVGFTLVELLVVIAIIGMLAALISAAVVAAMTTARNTAMKIEIDGIEAAVKAYNEKYSSYPPDFTDRGALNAHV